MQDYHIYTHYVEQQDVPKTSPKYRPINEPKTKVITDKEKEKGLSLNAPKKAIAGGLVIANKINSYVGELTENTVTASRRRVGLAYAGMAALAVSNPVLGLSAMASYTADKMITYNIKQYKENLNADFIRQLSGGTVKTRG
jgi:hypothetical protein